MGWQGCFDGLAFADGNTEGAVRRDVYAQLGVLIVIARVVERDDVTPEELLLGKDAFREQYLGERRNRFFAAYMAKAKERMRIEIQQDVVTRMLADTSSAGGQVWSPEHGHFH